MKVAFNARLLSSPALRGWNRYTINLLIELSLSGIELFLYSDQPLHESHLAKLSKGSYQVHISPAMRYIYWEQYWLPKQCKKDQVDILHCPFNFGLPWSSSCPRVLTLHDAIDLVYYSQRSARQVAQGRALPAHATGSGGGSGCAKKVQTQHTTWWQQLSLADIQNRIYHWVARNRADYIITVSQHSKNDIIQYLHIPENKIIVIYEAADAQFHKPIASAQKQQIRNQYHLNHPYIFYVGGWEKRKNIPFLIRAFAQANLEGVDLVLAGGKDEERVPLMQLAESLLIADRLRLLNWVEDADLPALYAEAVCFVYPSEYEGFGLQLCEAMAVGCPILAARATCLPEVLGDGGETFAVSEIQELVALLKRIVNDRHYCSHLANQAKKRSKNFSWQKTAQRSEQVYKELAVVL